MKKLVALLMLIIAISSYTVNAQGITAKGLIGGINYANASGDYAEDYNAKLGFAVGAFLTFSISEQFALRPEVFYTSKGFAIESEENQVGVDYEYSLKSEGTASFNYLEIPVLGVFSVNQNLNIFVGPYVEFYLSGEMETEIEGYFNYNTGSSWETENINESDSEDIKSDEINSPGFGLTFGGEYLIGQFSIGARYSLGLSNIPDNDDFEVKHSNIQLLVSINF